MCFLLLVTITTCWYYMSTEEQARIDNNDEGDLSNFQSPDAKANVQNEGLRRSARTKKATAKTPVSKKANAP